MCFICGKILPTFLKNRVQHLKRCSRVYGITISDLKQGSNDNDLEQTALYSIEDSTPGSPRSSESDTEKNPKFINSAFMSTARSLSQATKHSINTVLMNNARTLAKVKRQKVIKRNPYFHTRFRKSPDEIPPHKRLSHSNILIDAFLYASSNSFSYFLSHFHSDHYDGLEGKSWSYGPIYCSNTTAILCSQQLNVPTKYLHPLPMNTPIDLECQGKSVSVTLLDANHCPGAVMFLFHLGTRWILHVGDFRWHRSNMLGSIQRALSVGKRNLNRIIPLNEIYLDTTYCDNRYAQIPTQQEAITASQEIMRQSMRIKNHKILYLFGSYTIGKEKIYLAMAKEFNKKIYVNSPKYKILQTLDWSSIDYSLDLLTTYKHETDIWVVPLGHVGFNHMQKYLDVANRIHKKNSKWLKKKVRVYTCGRVSTNRVEIFGQEEKRI